MSSVELNQWRAHLPPRVLPALTDSSPTHHRLRSHSSNETKSQSRKAGSIGSLNFNPFQIMYLLPGGIDAFHSYRGGVSNVISTMNDPQDGMLS